VWDGALLGALGHEVRLMPAQYVKAYIKRNKHDAAERPLLGQAFHERSVVAVIVVAGPNSLPSPRCRLPAPARAAIEADAGDERRRGKGEEAATVGPIEPGECKPIDARCKSWPERETAGAGRLRSRSRPRKL